MALRVADIIVETSYNFLKWRALDTCEGPLPNGAVR